MQIIGNLPQIVFASLVNLIEQFATLIPRLAAALIVFIFGLYISEWVGRGVSRLLAKVYLDVAFHKSGLKKMLERVGLKYPVSRVLGVLATWFLYVAFLIAIADILRLPQITEFLKGIVLYIPNVVVAVIILLVGALLAEMSRKIIVSALRARKLSDLIILGALARYAILVFTVMAVLFHLKVASELITIILSGLVFMIALAGGLAFGLGGKQQASEFLQRITRRKE